jgi:integrase
LRKATADRDGGLVFDAGNSTLGEYLDRWLNTSVRDTVRRSTYVRYEGLVRNHIKRLIGRLKRKGLSPTHVRSLYRKKLDPGLAPRSSVNYIHVTLHKALEQAVLDGLVPRNVAEGVKTPRVHKEEVKPLFPHSGTSVALSSQWGPFGGSVPARHTHGLATG